MKNPFSSKEVPTDEEIADFLGGFSQKTEPVRDYSEALWVGLRKRMDASYRKINNGNDKV